MSDKLSEIQLSEIQEELVSVASFRDPSEAQMAKGMLEAAGIECLMQGENANELFPGALRVRLQVREVDEAAAKALLADSEQGAVDDVE
jgi:hypothetical protein